MSHLGDGPGTRPAYSPAVIAAAGRCLAAWDARYGAAPFDRVERELRREFRLLLQWLFIRGEPDPTHPGAEAVAAWLRPAKGLDVAALREAVLARLFALTQHHTFAPYAAAAERPRYPDRQHFLRFRWYQRELMRRSRDVLLRATTEGIAELERRTLPFYEAAGLGAGSGGDVPSQDDVFAASNAEVERLLGVLVGPTHPRPFRVLEAACGEGRLVRSLRARFPGAVVMGTNMFGATGVLPDVLSGGRGGIVGALVERMPFRDGAFDAVVSTEVIEHLVRPGDLVREIARLLRPGGAFVVTAPSLHALGLSPNPLTYAAGLLGTVTESLASPHHGLYEPLLDIPLVHRAFSIREFRRLFREHFPAIRVDTIRFTHLRRFRLDALAPRLPILRRFGGLLVAWGEKPHRLPSEPTAASSALPGTG